MSPVIPIDSPYLSDNINRSLLLPFSIIIFGGLETVLSYSSTEVLACKLAFYVGFVSEFTLNFDIFIVSAYNVKLLLLPL